MTSVPEVPMELQSQLPPASAFLLSPPDSIRTRLFQLRADESEWGEVLAVSAAISAKRREIEDRDEERCRCSAPGSESVEALNEDDHAISLQTLYRELDDWTWPARLADEPVLAWNYLMNRGYERERLLRDAHRCREAGWIVLPHARRTLLYNYQSDLWHLPDSFLRRDPAFLRALLDTGDGQAVSLLWTSPLVPTPDICKGSRPHGPDIATVAAILAAQRHPPRIFLRSGLL